MFDPLESDFETAGVQMGKPLLDERVPYRVRNSRKFLSARLGRMLEQSKPQRQRFVVLLVHEAQAGSPPTKYFARLE
jgi:hypothetical protein